MELSERVTRLVTAIGRLLYDSLSKDRSYEFWTLTLQHWVPRLGRASLEGSRRAQQVRNDDERLDKSQLPQSLRSPRDERPHLPPRLPQRRPPNRRRPPPPQQSPNDLARRRLQ